MSRITRVLVVLFGGLLATSHAQNVERVLFGLTNSWKYNQTTSYDGSNWTARTFDDSLLPSGRGVLAWESNNTFVTSRTNTVLTIGRLTYYFRTHFTFTNNPFGATLIFSNIIDDGGVFYLNGVEVQRLYLPDAPAPITYNTLATSHEATSFDVFTLSGPVVETNLVVGDNVLAVEVHQQAANSSDIIFGLALSASLPDTNPPPTLRMPSSLPVYGYEFTNAFGNLTFTDPVAILSPPGEINRLFVVEQRGRVAVITNLALPTRSVFLDISSRIIGGVPGDERGLLGMAFHPGFTTNGYFYIFYSLNSTTPGIATNVLHQRVSRMQVSVTNLNVAATNELILINQRDDYGNHNGGDLHFGPDGYLYISLGDEGDQNDAGNNSQRIDKDFFSAIMRLDVDGRPESIAPNPHPSNTNNPGGVINYWIPANNPYIGATSFNGGPVLSNNVRTEFYAVGMRNPWRFSFDPLTGFLYCGDVGGGLWEEINIVTRGGNYGWAYREGAHAGPKAPTPGFTSIDPIQEYSHGSGTNQGFSVTGGVVYRGDRVPDLVGAYVFADYVSGNVWMLRYNGTNTVPFVRIATDLSIAGFGVDPRNGDLLSADQSEDTIKRLVVGTTIASGGPIPPTLWHTGAFTNLTSLESETAPLTPNAGVVPYDINVPFWSDNAHKTRWFFRPNPALRFTFSRTDNWSFATGTVWVKHFDLELTNGVPSSAKRLETRFIVRNAAGIYGLTYRWGNSLTNATLVPDEGMDESFVVNDGGILRTQIWHYPGRSECLTCHTPVGGLALGFNTAQLNREVDFGNGPTNQIDALRRAGYFNNVISNLNLLPALARADDDTWSREWRVRSYLAVNCTQCHQPGGTGAGSWDARYTNPLSAAGLIRGLLNNTGGDPDNRVIVPGDLPHSMLLTRISFRGPGQMPPVATTLLDRQSIALLSSWITNDLPSWQSFADWQTARFGATNAPGSGPDDDPDVDLAPNALEWLTGTDPNSGASFHAVSVSDAVRIHVPQIATRGFELQSAPALSSPEWQPVDVPANRPFYSASNRLHTLELPATNPTRFYRLRVFEP